MPWLAAQVHAGSEFVVERRLAESDFVVFVARCQRRVKHRHMRRPRLAIHPLLPRLLFVNAADEIALTARLLRERFSNSAWVMRRHDRAPLLVPELRHLQPARSGRGRRV
jgi:hypothetical protein